MAFNASAAFVLPRHIRVKDGVEARGITETTTLTYRSSQYQILTLTAGSPLTCMLPSAKNGAYFWIKNSSSSNAALNINEPSGGATITTAAIGEGCLIVSDGSSWYEVIKA